MGRKKILIIILVVGCLLIFIGCGLKIFRNLQGEEKEPTVVERISVKDAIVGEVGYYQEDGNIVYVCDLENKAPHDVTVHKIIITFENIETGEQFYQKVVELEETIKANDHTGIILDERGITPSDVQDHSIKIKVE